MDNSHQAKGELLKQIHANGGILTITTAETEPTTRQYLEEMASAGLIQEIERTAQQVTYRLKEYDG